MIRNVSYEFSSLKWFFLGRIFAPKIEKIVSVDSSDDFSAKIQIEKTSFLKLFRFFEFSRQKGGNGIYEKLMNLVRKFKHETFVMFVKRRFWLFTKVDNQ